jgi:hypothetical protein
MLLRQRPLACSVCPTPYCQTCASRTNYRCRYGKINERGMISFVAVMRLLQWKPDKRRRKAMNGRRFAVVTGLLMAAALAFSLPARVPVTNAATPQEVQTVTVTTTLQSATGGESGDLMTAFKAGQVTGVSFAPTLRRCPAIPRTPSMVRSNGKMGHGSPSPDVRRVRPTRLLPSLR